MLENIRQGHIHICIRFSHYSNVVPLWTLETCSDAQLEL